MEEENEGATGFNQKMSVVMSVTDEFECVLVYVDYTSILQLFQYTFA